LCHQRHPEGHQTRDDADQILRSCERGEMLIKQLLAFSRKQPVRPEIVDLAALVRDLERTLRRLITEQVEINTVLAPDAGHVNADVGQLEHLLINLVVNARDAMPGGGRLTIEVANVTLDESYARQHPGVEQGEHVMLAVTDTGVGMDPETRGRMFEPFFTTKEPGRGTGLGLASVYGIVKQFQGHLAVSSEPNQGTSVRVYLPRVPAPARVAMTKPTRMASLHGIETVLVVEDHEILRQFSCQVLRQYGYQVLEAGRPAAAIELCEQHPRDIHLLLTDVVLPGMNGFDLASRARQSRPAMPVLFMSGHSMDALDRHRGEVVLEKPFAPQVLLTQIRKLLDAAPAP
jgi:two-component system cell cycle sensor histidine kinase/response regulator CckA